MLKVHSAGISALNGEYERKNNKLYVSTKNPNIRIEQTSIPSLHLPYIWAFTEYMPDIKFTVTWYIHDITDDHAEPPKKGWGVLAGLPETPIVEGGQIRRKQFEWKYSQRSTINDMISRGILTKADAYLIAGDGDENDVRIAEAFKKQNVLASIDRKLSPRQRLSPHDLYNKGILMEGAFEDAAKVLEAKKTEKENITQKLNMKFGDRMTPQEITARGVITEDEMKLDMKAVREAQMATKQNVSSHLERHLSPRFRMSHDDLEERNITPRGAFNDAYAATKNMERQRKQAQDKIKTKYSNRPMPDEMVQRGVINESEFIKDHETVVNEQKELKKRVSENMEKRLDPKQRLSKDDLENRNIVPQGSFDDVISATGKVQLAKRDSVTKLQRKLGDRSTPEEITARGIADPNEFQKDYEEVLKDNAKLKKQKSANLESSLKHRPPIESITANKTEMPPQ